MSTRSSAIFLTVALFVFLAIPPQLTADQQEYAPYIYYYADTLKSLVVERVDGSDSRVLTELPPDNTLFSSFGWSPSGEWVAWLNGQWNGPGNVRLTPWIVRSDGREQCCHALDDIHDVTFLKWSPVNDVLYVVDRLDFSSIRLLLVDVPTDKILAQFSYENPLATDFEFPPQGTWSDDGQQAYAVFAALGTETLITLSPGGTVQARVFGGPREYNLRSFLGGRALFTTRRQQNENVPQLLIQDVTSGREVVILAGDPDAEANAYWNEDLTYALIQLRWFNDDNRVERTEYRLLDWEHQSVIPLPDSTFVQSDDSYIYLSDNLWSDKGSFAALGEDEGRLSVLSARTGELHVVDVENVIDWHWSTSDLTLWIQAGRDEPNDSIVYRYEPEFADISAGTSIGRWLCAILVSVFS